MIAAVAILIFFVKAAYGHIVVKDITATINFSHLQNFKLHRYTEVRNFVMVKN